MNPAVIIGVIGAATFIMGIGALVAPEFVMARVLGFAFDQAFSPNFVRGEVRAAYGGMFAVIGLFTLLSARAPELHRGRIAMLACLWLGLAGGRLLSVTIDGSPGGFGWFALAFELVFGTALLLSSRATPAVPVYT